MYRRRPRLREVVDGNHEQEMLALADGLFAAVERGDIDAVRVTYAPDAVIWHNNDGREQTVDENLRVLAWAISKIAGFRYENIRRTATVDGFIEQHVLRGRAPNGEELRVAACIVCTVAGGRITRLDEYLDPAQIAPLI